MTLREMREAFFARPQSAQANGAANDSADGDALSTAAPEPMPAKKMDAVETLHEAAALRPMPPLRKETVATEQQTIVSGPAYRVLGVAFKTYILLETEDSLIIIDQHAAFERLKYEEYLHLLESGNAAQQLLIANIMRVSARERADLMENLPLLRELGFEIEPFGEADIKIGAVPHVLGYADPQPLLHDVLANLHSLLQRKHGHAAQRNFADVLQARRESRRYAHKRSHGRTGGNHAFHRRSAILPAR